MMRMNREKVGGFPYEAYSVSTCMGMYSHYIS